MAATLPEKLGALAYVLFFTAGFYCWAIYGLLMFYGNAYVRTALLLYSAWIWIGPGRWAPQTGTAWPWLRRSPIWKCAAAYSPMRLVKTAELDPEHNYVLGFHPHGIISFSAFVTFATEALDISEEYPGITFHLLTLVQNFLVPFIRDCTLAHGICDCAKKTCLNLLKRGQGKAIILCVGGAREALLAEPDTFEIVLGKRTGFVKVAVQTGASLVPVISFGENNIFKVSRPEKDSFAAKLQKYLLNAVGLGFPIFHGTGMMISSVGVLPYQGPIHVVIGAPIPVPKFDGDVNSDEGRRLVYEVHEKYVGALRKLWDRYKDRFALDRKGTFRIVDDVPRPVPTAAAAAVQGMAPSDVTAGSRGEH